MTNSVTLLDERNLSHSSETVDMADAYRAGMRKLAASVCLITARQGSKLSGMVATAVTSVSAEPPTLLICVNRNASIFEVIQQTGAFCVNVLSNESVPLIDVFSSSARRAERFQSGEWLSLKSGTPASGDALVAFDCQVVKAVDWYSHAIFFGNVTDVVHPNLELSPLLYMDRQYHCLGDLPA